MSNLVIVESPAKAKTIEKYLGKDYVVKASMGHLRDLPKKKMGVDLEDTFQPSYIPIEGKEKTIADLAKAASKSEMIYLATDPDREGEAISWHLKELLELPDEKTRRVTFNEITKRAVTEGIASPRNIDIPLVDAQQARRVLDRIVGYKLSPFLWKKVRRGLSAGRVQSAVTRMVVDREREIRAFVPEEYWTVDVTLEASGAPFTASFWGDASGKRELHSEAETMEIVSAVENAAFSVTSVKRSERKKSPAPPFTTSTLQQEASRKLGMSSKRTMAVAQALYEGVDIDGSGPVGLITYMRTDSLRISEEALYSAREMIAARYGSAFLPEKARRYKTKKGAQDAHEAIRPSNPSLTPEEAKSGLTPDQYKLYKLIWSRFTASQMTDQVLDTVSADISAGEYIFRATGYKVKFAGFTAVYEESRDDAEDAAARSLPELSEGTALKKKEIKPAQHFTQPPPRYTEASLIKAMEGNGVGRPSTYAPTISTILEREYVTKEGRALRPTTLGEAVTDLMIARFSDIIDLHFTAQMEQQLDEIEEGRADYLSLVKDFYGRFSTELSDAEREMAETRVKVADEVTDVICDQCGERMVIKHGRFGKFLACPRYPECKNTKPLAEDTGGICPLCGGRVMKMKSRNGNPYYGCEKYPACTFMTWDVPQKKTCPECGGTLFRRFNREEQKILCLKEDCGYSEPLKTRGRKPALRPTEPVSEVESGNVPSAAETEEKTKKTASKKAPSKKSTAKKTTAKKTAAKKTAAKKTAEKKPAAKKTASKSASKKASNEGGDAK